MPLIYTDLVFLKADAYGTPERPVNYDSGEAIRFADFYDEAGGKAVRATISRDCDPATFPVPYTKCEADVTIAERRNNDGKLTGIKYRVDAVRHNVTNAKPSEPVKA